MQYTIFTQFGAGEHREIRFGGKTDDLDRAKAEVRMYAKMLVGAAVTDAKCKVIYVAGAPDMKLGQHIVPASWTIDAD